MDLLERAQTAGTPLIDGQQATFVWQGPEPPRLIADFNDWEDGEPLTLRAAGPGLWRYTRKFPANAYIEYAYLLDGERLPDPWNRQTISNGMGKNNHYFYMPQGAPTPLIRRQDVPHGVVTRHEVTAPRLVVGDKRLVYLYQPPVAAPVPLVVVFDGWDYYHRAKLPTLVDNLIAAGRIRPIALALIQNGGKARFVEYACSESVSAFIYRQVLPLAQAELQLVDHRQQPYGVLGASMGGLMALYTALRMSQIFGRVLSQSGAFRLGNYPTVVHSLVRDGAVLPLNIWMDAGAFEWLLEPNREMAALLREKGYPLTYHEYPGGHNYTCWRNDVALGLEALFPPEVARP